jgi:hypothetical protein
MYDANYVFSVAVYKNLLTFRNWRLYLTESAPAGRVAAALFLTELQVSESEARINVLAVELLRCLCFAFFFALTFLALSV